MANYYLDKTKMLPVKDFKDTYKVFFTIEAIRYHAMRQHVDSVQPARDIFILLTPKTLSFYGIEC